MGQQDGATLLLTGLEVMSSLRRSVRHDGLNSNPLQLSGLFRSRLDSPYHRVTWTPFGQVGGRLECEWGDLGADRGTDR